MESINEIPTSGKEFPEYYWRESFAHTPFANLKYRERTVLLMCRDERGMFILGAKAGYYPAGISRLPGGGVEGREPIIEAAQREGREELHLNANPEDYVPLAVIKAVVKAEGRMYRMDTYLFFINLNRQFITAGDDVSDIVRLDELEYRRLIEAYKKIPLENLQSGSEGQFSWGEYGKFYGFVHEIALREVLTREL